jgi:hypothetical protein
MTPRHRDAQLVNIDDLESAFLASFATAVAAPSYVMRDVDVTWTRERPPPLSPPDDQASPRGLESPCGATDC